MLLMPSPTAKRGPALPGSPALALLQWGCFSLLCAAGGTPGLRSMLHVALAQRLQTGFSPSTVAPGQCRSLSWPQLPQ